MTEDRRSCAHPSGCSNAARRRGLCARHGRDPEAEAVVDGGAHTIAERGDERQVTRHVADKVQNLADLVRVCGIDTSEWDVAEWRCSVWGAGPLYAVSAKLRRKTALVNARAEIEAMKADAQIVPWSSVLPTKTPSKSGNLLQIAIPDLHMGKLAWKPETGRNYDLAIAEQLFNEAVGKLVERTVFFGIERVLFVVGSDLLHTDNPNGTTTKGTPQDTDGRFHRTFRKTRKMIVSAIDYLSMEAPVDVVMVPGNHDEQSTWHLGDSLECWYRGSDLVTVDNSPTHRKYYEFGQVMLMFTHGDKGKKPNYPLVMATEQPEMFGRTKYREAHTGHIHQLQVQEHHGVRVRVSPALCAADAWHAANQYVGNQRAAEAFVWNRDEGPIAQATWTVPE